jgi:membrane-bound lytic murein transglycosylase D
VSAVGLTVLIVGSYQIFFKPEEVEQNSGTKIESKPTDPVEKKVDEAKPESATQPTTNDKTQGATQEYIIVEGDNLGSIAGKFETTVEKIKTANNIQDETTLQIGQKIIIVK